MSKTQAMGVLIVARHHESDWNHKGLWTGMRDRHLTEYGFKKSEEMGLLINEIQINRAFASMQVRSIETLSSMLEALGQYHVPTEHSLALNERDYGDYTAKNKWEMEKILGEDGWNNVRREWDCPVPNGETLKMVYARVIPFFLESILPHLRKGENVLLVSHGNAIRALMKYIENISDDKVKDLEMLFGAVLVYKLDWDGHLISKDVRKTLSQVNA
ncbi:MAG: histidine phosphatase family protein [bacterium]